MYDSSGHGSQKLLNDLRFRDQCSGSYREEGEEEIKEVGIAALNRGVSSFKIWFRSEAK